jgi:hypothetical protein
MDREQAADSTDAIGQLQSPLLFERGEGEGEELK